LFLNFSGLSFWISKVVLPDWQIAGTTRKNSNIKKQNLKAR